MRIIFFGSVKFSKCCVDRLIKDGNEILGICTLKESDFNTDFCDLSSLAIKNKIPFIYFKKSENTKVLQWIKNLKPDIIFCIGWSSLLDDDFLKVAPLGVVGYHPALLPKNRGRHPIIWALSLGLKETGSTFFFMRKKADSGPIISQKVVPIEDNDNADSLYKKLIEVALAQLTEFVPLLKSHKIKTKKQDDKVANYWRKRNFNDGIIDWRMDSLSIRNLIRSLSKPYCGASFIHQKIFYKVWECEIINCNSKNIEPGKILNVYNNQVIIKCGYGAIKIKNIEPSINFKEGEYL